MSSILSRLFPPYDKPEPLTPGMYHYMAPDDAPIPYRLHLRVESAEASVLIVNAATVLHLNQTATAHALQIVNGLSEEKAAEIIAERYNVSHTRALEDQRELREQILTLATIPDIDPVVFLGMDRAEPFAKRPLAPYRLDLALTYRCAPDGTLDKLARRRVDRELSTIEWEQIISTAWDAGIPHVTFTGGEPTLREDLRDLIAYSEDKGQVTGLLTDGKRLADESYLGSLSLAGLDHILVTYLRDDPLSMQGLSNALASDIFTAVHLTITPQIAGEVIERLDEIHKLGAPAVSLSGSERSEAISDSLSKARDHCAHIGIDLIWDLPAPYSATNPINLELEKAPTGAGKAWLYVEPDGDILPGQGIDKVLGNLLRDTWAEIWSKAID